MDIRAEIAAAAGQPPVDIEPQGGGSVSVVYRVSFRSDPPLIVKVDEDGTASLPVEAFMLRFLAEQTQLPTPAVRFVSDRLLMMTYAPGSSRFSSAAESHAAELLASLHNITSPTFGFERDTVIGGLRQPNPLTDSWVSFFRDHRLLFMVGEAARAGRLPPTISERIEQLCTRLDSLLPEPERPSLIHGDVWTNNVLAEGDRITAFLDPAIYFAHNEIELAFTTLFGTFGRDFFNRYNELRPIAPGFFEERRELYNLYPLLVHIRLFGGSYVASVARTLERFGF